MIVLHVKYTSDRARLESYLKAANEANIPVLSRAEAGCRQYEFFLGAQQDNQNTLLLLEQWVDEEALEYHRNTPHFQALQPIKAEWVDNTDIQRFDI